MTEPNMTEPNVTDPAMTDAEMTEPSVTKPSMTDLPAAASPAKSSGFRGNPGWAARLLRPDPARVSPDDLGYYLGFFGPMPWVLYAVAVLMTLYVPLVVMDPAALPPLSVAALVALVVTFALIALPSATPLPAWRTVVILAVVTFALVAVAWPMPYTNEIPVTAGWQLNPCDLLLFCLALRGRYVSAWVGQLIMQGVFAAWSVCSTGSPWLGLGFSYGQALPLAGVTLFALGLHRTARQIVAHRAAERERAEREALERASDEQLSIGLQEIRDLAGPTLEAIAAGGRPDRGGVRGLEAALRDMIRGRNLAMEPLTTALRRARESGMDIVVLDDAGEADLPSAVTAALARWAAARVDAACAHDMTLRLTLYRDPARGEQALLTVTIDGNPAGQLHVATQA